MIGLFPALSRQFASPSAAMSDTALMTPYLDFDIGFHSGFYASNFNFYVLDQLLFLLLTAVEERFHCAKGRRCFNEG